MNKLLLFLMLIIPSLSFADSKISQLPADSSPQSSDVIPAVQNSNSSNVKMTLSTLSTYFGSGGGGSGNVGVGTFNNVPVYIGATGVGPGIMTDTGTNVGVSQSSPAYKLDVNGTVHSLGVTTNGNVGVGTFLSTNNLDVSGSVGIGTAFAGYQGAPTNGLMVLGNVEIGTTALAPLSQLTVSSGVNNANNITMYSTNGSGTSTAAWFVAKTATSFGIVGAYPSTYTVGNGTRASRMALISSTGSTGITLDSDTTNQNIIFASDGTPKDVMDTNGNIGIGTLAPGQTLDVWGTVSMFSVSSTGTIKSQGTSGVNCSGSPDSSFATKNGIVTAC